MSVSKEQREIDKYMGLEKISVKNGFMLDEVRAYRKACREQYQIKPFKVEHLPASFVWGNTPQGYDFWENLAVALDLWDYSGDE